MFTRKEQKAATLEKILDVSSRQLRTSGISGTGIAAVMKEAGLTHGGFYAHFDNKNELTRAAFTHAVSRNQAHWFERARQKGNDFGSRLKQLARDYLSPRHRDEVDASCAISALAAEVPRSDAAFRAHYSRAVLKTLDDIADHDKQHQDDAIVFFSLCVGGLLLARAVEDRKTSDRILRTTRKAAQALISDQPESGQEASQRQVDPLQ